MDEITYTPQSLVDLVEKKIKSIFTGQISVSGELSNVKISGQHLYSLLKDDETGIQLIIWNVKNSGLNYENIKNGVKITATGRISVYKKSGSINLICNKIQFDGLGDLFVQYENLKKEYMEKHYFDESRKKQIPQYINRLGIITAHDGAALQDILFVLKQNGFTGEVIIKNTIVQGNMCPKSIADNINYFMELDKEISIDVLLITRGGGSFEDLIGFSHQNVIEAIFNCSIPTISAVGHEVDTMLSDFVADVRAPTPSIGAEIVSESHKKIILKINKHMQNIEECEYRLSTYINACKYRINNINNTIVSPQKYIDNINEKLNIANNTFSSMYDIIKELNTKLQIIRAKTDMCDINKQLKRGYCILDINSNEINDNVIGKKLKLQVNNHILTIKILGIDE